MATLQIHDLRPDVRVLAVDLRDIVRVLGASALGADWEVNNVTGGRGDFEATGGEAAERLEALAQTGVRIAGELLAALAGAVVQVISGEFRAYLSSTKAPWVVVRAVDSSWYEVETHDGDVLSLIRSSFTDVRLKP